MDNIRECFASGIFGSNLEPSNMLYLIIEFKLLEPIRANRTPKVKGVVDLKLKELSLLTRNPTNFKEMENLKTQ